MIRDIVNKIDWKKIELLPVIAQDYQSDEVLMLAYMNKEALELTLKGKKPTTSQEVNKESGKKAKQAATYR